MKLIFFDIDGTLIDRGKRMAESTPEAIRRARENGHICIVNTGRTASLVLDWLPQLAPFDGYLCGCGTQLFFQGKELLHKTFTVEEAEDIIKGLEEHRIDAILEGTGDNYHNPLDRMHTGEFRKYIMDHYPERRWGNYDQAPGNYDKFFCYADDPENVRRFIAQREGLLDLIDREHGYFEVVPKGYSKATGMDRLIEYINTCGDYQDKVSLADTVCIGDSNNDLPMLEHAGIAIAMGESSQQVLQMADFVTAKVMEDGIEKALDWLGVLKFSDK